MEHFAVYNKICIIFGNNLLYQAYTCGLYLSRKCVYTISWFYMLTVFMFIESIY